MLGCCPVALLKRCRRALALHVVLVASEDIGLLEVRIQIGFGIKQGDAHCELGDASRWGVDMVRDRVARDRASGSQAKDHTSLLVPIVPINRFASSLSLRF